MRALGRDEGRDLTELDVLPSPFRTVVAPSPTAFACGVHGGVDAVVHAVTLHKPLVASNGRREFVDTNVGGTLNLLEEAVAAGVGRFVLTSSTTTFDRALSPPAGRARGLYAKRGWRMFDRLDRVHVNDRAREVLGWAPLHDFGSALERLPPARTAQRAGARRGGEGLPRGALRPYTTR
jgi:nucleoside-diphosphate-sugar epimerase